MGTVYHLADQQEPFAPHRALSRPLAEAQSLHRALKAGRRLADADALDGITRGIEAINHALEASVQPGLVHRLVACMPDVNALADTLVAHPVSAAAVAIAVQRLMNAGISAPKPAELLTAAAMAQDGLRKLHSRLLEAKAEVVSLRKRRRRAPSGAKRRATA